MSPLHHPRAGRRRQVAARRRAAPRPRRRHRGTLGALPVVRGRDQLLAARRGLPSRRRRGRACEGALPARKRRDVLVDPHVARGTGRCTTARSRPRRPPLGRADVPRHDRARGRLEPRRADPPSLHCPCRAARRSPGLEWWEAECDHGAARAPQRVRERRARDQPRGTGARGRADPPADRRGGRGQPPLRRGDAGHGRGGRRWSRDDGGAADRPSPARRAPRPATTPGAGARAAGFGRGQGVPSRSGCRADTRGRAAGRVCASARSRAQGADTPERA